MADNFKAHRPEFGEKLGQMRALGPSGLARRIEEARARVLAGKAVVPEGKAARGKRGRPGLGKPWEAMGVSRATYFARKRGGELGE